MSADLNNDMASQEVDDLVFEIPDVIEPCDDLHREYLLSVVADYDLSMIGDVPHFTDVEEDSVLSLVTREILELQRSNLQNFAPEDGFKEGDMRLSIHNAIEQTLRESKGLAEQKGNHSPDDPQDIFNYMLDQAANLRASKSGIARYQQFLEQHEHEELWDYLVQSADYEVWSKVILAGKTMDFEVLDSLPSVPLPQEDGWYIAIITKRDGSRWYRGYGGQAFREGGVWKRVTKEHTRLVLKKDRNSLFYKTWRGDVDVANDSVESLDDLPRTVKFICVGTDQSGLQGDARFLFKNIAEMFFTVIFRFLQTQSLLKWLPPGSSLPAEPVGCNVALPLWQYDADASKRSFSLLLRSDDPEVREWARSRILPGLAKARALRWVGDVDNSNIALGSRKAANKDKATTHLRNCDESQGDAKVVRVKCVACNTETDDTVPQYVVADGRYLARKLVCEGSCQPSAAQVKNQRLKSARTKHIPVANSKYASAKTGWLSVGTAHDHIRKFGYVRSPN